MVIDIQDTAVCGYFDFGNLHNIKGKLETVVERALEREMNYWFYRSDEVALRQKCVRLATDVFSAASYGGWTGRGHKKR